MRTSQSTAGRADSRGRLYAQDLVVLVTEEGDGHSSLSCSTCSSDTMDIGLDRRRHLPVDHERHVRHIDTTTSLERWSRARRRQHAEQAGKSIKPGIRTRSVATRILCSPSRRLWRAASRCSWFLPEWSVVAENPARWMSLQTMSAVFFWLQKMIIGGGRPMLPRIWIRRCLDA